VQKRVITYILVVKGSSVIWIQVLFSVQLFVYSMRSFGNLRLEPLVVWLLLLHLLNLRFGRSKADMGSMALALV
jgi:uncharacterized membrane-anchored protein